MEMQILDEKIVVPAVVLLEREAGVIDKYPVKITYASMRSDPGIWTLDVEMEQETELDDVPLLPEDLRDIEEFEDYEVTLVMAREARMTVDQYQRVVLALHSEGWVVEDGAGSVDLYSETAS